MAATLKAHKKKERQSASKVHIFMEIKVAMEEQIRLVEEDNVSVEWYFSLHLHQIVG